MAWFNYINMFLARSMERVNEIGVKKMLGSTQIHLIVQFFTESMVINLASFVLAIIILLLAQQPFESWLGKDVSGVFFNGIPFITQVFAGILMGSMWRHCILQHAYRHISRSRYWVANFSPQNKEYLLIRV